jgi:hypothetical protein
MFLKFGVGLLASGLLAYAGVVDVVAPNANTSTNGNSFQFGVFGEGASAPYVFQWQIAASQLTALVGDSLTSIGFRLNTGAASVTGPTVIGTFNLELSPSANPLGALSTTFANNIGAGGVTVRSGALTLGALTGGVGPNPFFLIPFSTSYLYSGGDLVVTASINGGSSFSVDANTYVTGGLEDSFSNLNGSARVEFYNIPVTEFEATTVSTATPEPATLFLFGSGMLIAGAIRLRRSRRS